MPATPALAVNKRVLAADERIAEVLFGLIMVLTFTGSLSVADAGRDDIRAMLIGAIGCNALKSYATHAFAEQWPYILGSLFIFVTLFMPAGIVGVPDQLRALRRRFRPPAVQPVSPGKAPAAAGDEATP